MHTNHRRRVRRDDYINSYYNISKKLWKQLLSSKRRAQERELMDLELYDDLPKKEYKHILWDMF